MWIHPLQDPVKEIVGATDRWWPAGKPTFHECVLPGIEPEKGDDYVESAW